MNSYNLVNSIRINRYSSTPKYQQVTDSIVNLVESGMLSINTGLPSINELSAALDISRDTIEKGYKSLRDLGIVTSVPGKGYYVAEKECLKKYRVCLIFNNWSEHKKIIYDSFLDRLGDEAAVELNIYYDNIEQFEKLLSSKNGHFTHYIVIPPIVERMGHIKDILNSIPSEKLIILDKFPSELQNSSCAVFQDFGRDIFYALKNASKALSRYKNLKIIFPKGNLFPKEILFGLKNFCLVNNFNYQVIESIRPQSLVKGDVFITLSENSLVEVVEMAQNAKLTIGKDVGLISYNEAPIKRILLNGITTISTDFVKLGTETATLILNNLQKKIQVPFCLRLRNSL